MSQDMQAFFDTALAGVIAQSQGAGEKLAACDIYRGKNGRKCAIGFLISDDQFDEKHNFRAVDEPPVIEMLKASHPAVEFNKDMVGFLEDLQCAYDCSDIKRTGKDFLPTFKKNAGEVAQKYGLEIKYEH